MKNSIANDHWRLSSFTGGFNINTEGNCAHVCLPMTTDTLSYDQQRANAILICNAPKLVAALVSIEQAAIGKNPQGIAKAIMNSQALLNGLRKGGVIND